jgi:hypothetical protein
MTRKDYEAIAKVLKEQRDSGACLQTTANLARELATVFVQDNPRFLPHRFLVACGLTQYKG